MVFVNSYTESLRQAFESDLEKIPDTYEKTIKGIVEKIHEEVISQIEFYIQDDLLNNVQWRMCQEAARVAESMLMRALAGDDEEIKNLFGFNDWYMKHLYMGEKPTQWKLIEAIVDRRPDIFCDEKIVQQGAEIEHLTKEVGRLNNYIKSLREKYEGLSE